MDPSGLIQNKWMDGWMHYSVVIMSLYCYNIQRRAYNMACP